MVTVALTTRQLALLETVLLEHIEAEEDTDTVEELEEMSSALNALWRVSLVVN